MGDSRKKDDTSFAKYLRYAATALSLVSFLTTAAGMGFIVGEGNNWKGFLISFGIQAIVLVVGLKFFEMHAALKEKIGKTWKVMPISILVLLIFICAVGFSSFFSYVFLANTAYGKTKTNDYNIEIDQFLTEETKGLRDYNDAIGNKIQNQMRAYLVEFNGVSEKINNQAGSSISEIVEKAKLKQYNTKINDEDLVSDDRIDIFLGRFGNDGWVEDAHEDQLRHYNETFKNFKSDYNTALEMYKEYYSQIKSNTFSPEQAETLIAAIDQEITHLERQLSELDKIGDTQRNINDILRDVKGIVASKYNGLIQSLSQLKNVCITISQSRQDIIEKAEFDLNQVTKTLYSPETVDKKEINDAIENLKQLVTFYLQMDNKSIDNDLLQNISSCIIYLEEFRNYRQLNEEIRKFEEGNLRQRYVILPDPANGEKEQLELPEIYETDWIEKKKSDVETFIQLLKTLPNIDLLDRAITGQNTQQSSVFSEEYINSYREYINVTLEKAYMIERNKLVKLNEIEQAILFYDSRFPTMALICVPIAFFLDLTSFGIGMFLFFCLKRTKEKET